MKNDRSNTIIVLGSADPEMVEIARLGALLGVHTFQATRDGRPVRPGEEADSSSVDALYRKMISVEASTVLLVEQPGRRSHTGTWLLDQVAVADCWPVTFVEIDHHDPAQVWDPEVELCERSSLGQVARHLGVDLDPRQRMIGALDHDLPSALAQARERGELTLALGIYASGASHLFGGVPPDAYVAQAKATDDALSSVPVSEDGILQIWDQFPPSPSTAGATGEQYPLPALPLALALRRQPGLSIIRRRDGVLAWRLQAATPDQVRAWMASGPGILRDRAAPNACYGVPERGFAGGVVDPAWIAWADRDSWLGEPSPEEAAQRQAALIG